MCVYVREYVCMYVCIYKFSARVGCATMSIFKPSLTGLNVEFSFSLFNFITKGKEPSLPYYLLIAESRIIGFMSSPIVLALWEMPKILSRNWTRVAMSIFHDEMCVYECVCILVCVCVCVCVRVYDYNNHDNICFHICGSQS